jgi:hypothetical protein
MCRNYKMIFLTGLILLLFNSCKEEGFGPLFDDGVAPAAIQEAGVENMHGAAKITTVLPEDEDLLYVKAVVEVSPGKVREFKSSAFTNELYLEGFGASKPYEVKIYAVDRGENMSAPHTVTIHPLTPPVVLVYESLGIKPDFGGINVSFVNETEASLAIVIQAKDEQGDWVERETLYTKKDKGNFSARGFEAEEREFRVFVKDRWDNQSEAGIYTITPLFEEQIPKEGFSTYNLPGDNFIQHCCGTGVKDIWDGLTQTDGITFHTKPSNGVPGTFTFDMGETAILSRMKLWGRNQGDRVQYNMGNIKKFEIWGSATPPPANGEFPGDMILLGDFESVKPSGQPVGTNTSEDVETARAGEDFNFLSGVPPVRYIRVKVYNTWGGVSYWHIQEMTFWGKIQ